jgi:hypothetical protein
VHTNGVQHCAVVLQVEPWGRHWPVPQTPPVHSIEQHSLGCMHPKPSSLHTGVLAQTLFWQIPLQHSKLSKQNPPSGVQPPKPQVPLLGSQKKLQHSGSKVQGSPSGLHWLKPQVNVVGSQKKLQHSGSDMHGTPSGRQLLNPHT